MESATQVSAKDTLAGILNISNAIIGKKGTAFGIVSAIYYPRGALVHRITSKYNKTYNLFPCTASPGSLYGLTLLQVLFQESGHSHMGMYVISDGIMHHFMTLHSAIFVAGYAQVVMARVNKAPATIFQSVCAFPLVPETTFTS